MDLKQCQSSSDLYNYAKEKGIKHKNYKKYSKYEYDNFLKKRIILTNGDKWEDNIDKESFMKTSKFASCLSYQQSENIAMWKLYGCFRTSYSASFMHDLINNPDKYIEKIILYENEIDKDGFVYNGKPYLEIVDILYSSDDQSISHGDEHIQISFSINNIKQIIKHYCFYYENETRLILQLNDLEKNYKYAELKLKTNDGIKVCSSPIGPKIDGVEESELKNKVTYEYPLYCRKCSKFVDNKCVLVTNNDEKII